MPSARGGEDGLRNALQEVCAMAKVEGSEENFRLCLEKNCGQCPSFPGGDGEALYCARGESKGKVERNGCVCPDCPIWAKYGLGRTYYCD